MKEGLSQLPDGQFLPAMEMNCVEKDFRKNLSEKFGRTYTIGLSFDYDFKLNLGDVN